MKKKYIKLRRKFVHKFPLKLISTHCSGERNNRRENYGNLSQETALKRIHFRDDGYHIMASKPLTLLLYLPRQRFCELQNPRISHLGTKKVSNLLRSLSWPSFHKSKLDFKNYPLRMISILKVICRTRWTHKNSCGVSS